MYSIGLVVAQQQFLLTKLSSDHNARGRGSIGLRLPQGVLVWRLAYIQGSIWNAKRCIFKRLFKPWSPYPWAYKQLIAIIINGIQYARVGLVFFLSKWYLGVWGSSSLHPLQIKESTPWVKMTSLCSSYILPCETPPPHPHPHPTSVTHAVTLFLKLSFSSEFTTSTERWVIPFHDIYFPIYLDKTSVQYKDSGQTYLAYKLPAVDGKSQKSVHVTAVRANHTTICDWFTSFNSAGGKAPSSSLTACSPSRSFLLFETAELISSVINLWAPVL